MYASRRLSVSWNAFIAALQMEAACLQAACVWIANASTSAFMVSSCTPVAADDGAADAGAKDAEDDVREDGRATCSEGAMFGVSGSSRCHSGGQEMIAASTCISASVQSRVSPKWHALRRRWFLILAHASSNVGAEQFRWRLQAWELHPLIMQDVK
jgi:hypothetical protein